MDVIIKEVSVAMEKSDRERIESEFDETRRKAYEYQRADDIDAALKTWINFKDNGPLKNNREYLKKMDSEIDYLEG